MVLDREMVRRRRREWWAALALLLATAGSGGGVFAGLLIAPEWIVANAWLAALIPIVLVGSAIGAIIRISTNRPGWEAAPSPPPSAAERQRRRDLGPDPVPVLPMRPGA